MNQFNQLSKKTAFLVFFAAVLSCSSASNDDAEIKEQPTLNASEVIVAMDAGFNLGNTFDLSANNTSPESIKPIIDLYYNAGMRHIRIPVTWMDGFGNSNLANSSGTINFQNPRFVQLKAVIDYAISKNMYVVLNTHHEHWLKNKYDGTETYNTPFRNLWTGIATYFKDYSPYLIFEILNEPSGAFGDWSGGANPFNTEALAFTRKINEVGYKAVRETGGNNLTRIIMISTNGMGNHSMIEEVYPANTSLPGGGTDAYLAIQVHTYDPWSFCGENGNLTSWPGNSVIEKSLRTVAVHSRLLSVPVNYGEFGVGRQSNEYERNTDVVRTYYKIIRQVCADEKMSSTVWDDRGWFGLITKDGNGTYIFTNNIVPYMLAK